MKMFKSEALRKILNMLIASRPKMMDSPVSCLQPIIQYIWSYHSQYLEAASSIHK